MHLHTLGSVGLRDGAGGHVRSVLAQPKRLAMLALLAVYPEGICRRDQLLGLFWPDHGADRARAALRQALRFLRCEVGPGAIVNLGNECLAIDAQIVACDAREFTRACDERRFEDALQLYQGDFLAGLFISTASPEFDNWLEAERERLRQRALDAATALVARHRDRGQSSAAVHCLRRAIALAPEDEGLRRMLLQLLAESGDCASALRAYQDFVVYLKRDLDVAPSGSTRQLIATIRSHVSRDLVTQNRLAEAD